MSIPDSPEEIAVLALKWHCQIVYTNVTVDVKCCTQTAISKSNGLDR